MTRPQNFEELIAAGDPLDLLLAVTLLARDDRPGIDFAAVDQAFIELSAPLVASALGSIDAAGQAEALRLHMFGTLGFRGNETDYYDPENSLLSSVIARRTGIPISLALVYCELARRAGVAASGVAFPGHFLVRIDDAAGGHVLIDPFFGGRIVDDESLRALGSRVAGQGAMPKGFALTTSASALAPASTRAILLRWLMNLRGVHLKRGDFARALVALDHIVTLVPNDASALRDRGLLAARLGAVEQGRADLSRAALFATDPALSARIDEDLARLEAQRTPLN